MPTSSYTAGSRVIFTGGRLDPVLDLYHNPPTNTVPPQLNGLVFSAGSGAYTLGGTMSWNGQNVPTTLTFNTDTSVTPNLVSTVTVAGPDPVTIHNTITFGQNQNLVFDVTGSLTCDGYIRGHGGQGQTVVKTGSGTLYVTANPSTYYAWTTDDNPSSNSVGPKYNIQDGTVIFSNGGYFWNVDRPVTTPQTYSWKNTTPQGMYGYGLTIGDGIGIAGSAVMQISSSTANVTAPGSITINSDGLLDFNGKSVAGLNANLTINGGKLKLGGSDLYEGAGAGNITMVGGTIDTGNTTGSWGLGMYYNTTLDMRPDANGNIPTITASTGAGKFRTIDGGGVGPTVLVTHVGNGAIDARIDAFFHTGSVTKSGNGTLLCTGNSDNTGKTTISAGTMIIDGTTAGQDTYSVANGATLAGKGTIGLKAGTATAGLINVAGGGNLSPGSIDQVTGAHVFGPMTIGRTNYANTVTTLGDGGASAANLNISISSTSADQLILKVSSATSTIANDLVLNGANLNVNFLGGFIPANGASYTIVDNQATNNSLAALIGVSGTFANVTGGKVSVTGGTFDVSYTGGDGNDIVLSNFAAAITLLPGDANRDGKVSFADYILLANNFGQTGATWDMGDFNGDGKVSFADYILLANNFGQHVPEPATLGLLLIGGLGLIRRNRK